MTSIAYSPVSIQTSSQAAPLPPPWFGQVVLIMAHLRKQGVLDAITKPSPLCPPFRTRRRHRLCGRPFRLRDQRRTHAWRAFYQAVMPWAESFTALFGRTRLPARSTLSRFLSALLPGACRSPALLVSRRSAGLPPGQRAPDRWAC